MTNWSSWKKKVTIILSEGIFFNICVFFQCISVWNKLSEYIAFYITEDITSAEPFQKNWAMPEKIQTGHGGWGHGISRGLEERACGNSVG